MKGKKVAARKKISIEKKKKFLKTQKWYRIISLLCSLKSWQTLDEIFQIVATKEEIATFKHDTLERRTYRDLEGLKLLGLIKIPPKSRAYNLFGGLQIKSVHLSYSLDGKGVEKVFVVTHDPKTDCEDCIEVAPDDLLLAFFNFPPRKD